MYTVLLYLTDDCIAIVVLKAQVQELCEARFPMSCLYTHVDLDSAGPWHTLYATR
jgi:hypothetical protein